MRELRHQDRGRLELRRVAAPLLALGLFAGAAASAQAVAEVGVRPAAVAGRFYPAEAGRLRAAVEASLAEALPPPSPAVRPLALVVPHAGFVFSGPIAADAYRRAVGFDYDVVVILGTNHTVAPFAGVSVQQATGYATPLGVAPADTALARALLAADPLVRFDPAAHATEHSEEVQIPFVQVAFPAARIVTAVVGRPDLALATRFGELLGRALAGRRALVVASSDLSHYPSHDGATAADRRVLAAVAALDPARAAAAMDREERMGTPGLATAACGRGAILAALVAARALGATDGVVVSYANSGDTVAGERDRVVGYGAVAFGAGIRPIPPPTPAPPTAATTPAGAGSFPPLSAEDRHELLALARRTLERWYATGTLPLPRPAGAALLRPRGAFVTLTRRGELRGCIGHMAEDLPLALAVAKMALAAALEDPRFAPVGAGELAGLDLEISALTPFAAVAGPGEIVVGRDGVLLEKAGRRAVFLPQVAPEQGWSRDEMLDQLCAKAGLATGCWREGARLSTFQAEVFGEKSRP